MTRLRTLIVPAAAVLLSAASTGFGAASATPVVEQRPTLERLWYAQGWTHPIVVHMPIALLLAAAIAVLWKLVSRKVSDGLIYFCLFIGTGGAILSSLAGWAWAPQKNADYVDPFDAHSEIFWHRWGGIIITVVSVAVLFWATKRMRAKTRHDVKYKVVDRSGEQVGIARVETPTPRRPSQVGWQASVVLLAAGMGWVGHDGGELVYPGNFARIQAIAEGTRPIDIKGQAPKKKAEPAVTTPTAEKPAPTTATAPAVVAPATTRSVDAGPAVVPATTQAAVIPGPAVVGTIDFQKQVWPIFQDKCIYCHGPEKQKGKLRMDTEAFALAGGPDDGPLYVTGKSAESALIKRAVTEDEDEVMPPPKEAKKLTADELKILKTWVDEGARWPAAK